jgi:hypothetical protein
MGLHDTEEMLEAAKAQAILDEREIARLKAQRDVLLVEQTRVHRELGALCAASEAVVDAEDAWYYMVDVKRIREVLGTPLTLEPNPT